MKLELRRTVKMLTGDVVYNIYCDMTTVDMMAFVDAIRNYCAEFLGGYIPEPETQMTLQYNEQ